MKVFFGYLIYLTGFLIAISCGICGLVSIGYTMGLSLLVAAVPAAMGYGIMSVGKQLMKSAETPAQGLIKIENQTRKDDRVFPPSQETDQE